MAHSMIMLLIASRSLKKNAFSTVASLESSINVKLVHLPDSVDCIVVKYM